MCCVLYQPQVTYMRQVGLHTICFPPIQPPSSPQASPQRQATGNSTHFLQRNGLRRKSIINEALQRAFISTAAVVSHGSRVFPLHSLDCAALYLLSCTPVKNYCKYMHEHTTTSTNDTCCSCSVTPTY